jgi:hypothetical protein
LFYYSIFVLPNIVAIKTKIKTKSKTLFKREIKEAITKKKKKNFSSHFFFHFKNTALHRPSIASSYIEIRKAEKCDREKKTRELGKGKVCSFPSRPSRGQV